MDYGPANSPFASKSRNPRHELCSPPLSSTFNFLPPITCRPDSHPCFLLSTSRIARLFSLDFRELSILNPGSSYLALSSSLLRFSLVLFLFFIFFVLHVSVERKSPMRPGEERASVLRARRPARNCLKIVRVDGVETDVDTLNHLTRNDEAPLG